MRKKLPYRRKLTKAMIEADRAMLRALEKLTDYKPSDPAYSVERLQELEAAMLKAQADEARAELEYQRACAALEATKMALMIKVLAA
jgi:hypothetical protein